MIVSIASGQQPRLTMDPTEPDETIKAYIVQVSLGDVQRLISFSVMNVSLGNHPKT